MLHGLSLLHGGPGVERLSITDAASLAAAFIYEHIADGKELHEAREEWLDAQFPSGPTLQSRIAELNEMGGTSIPDGVVADGPHPLDAMVARAQQAARERAVESPP